MLKLRLLPVDLNTPLEYLEEQLHTLPSVLQDRVNSFHVPQDRLTSLYTRLLVRQAIAEDLNVTVDGVVLQYDSHGKPYVPARKDYYFSVSHCDGMVAFVSHNKPIGVDVEDIKERNLKIQRRLYTPSEVAYVDGGTLHDLNFFTVWTMKEAYSKMLGLGLGVPFSSIDTMELKQKGYYSSHMVDGFVVTICTEDAHTLEVEITNITV